MTPKGFRHALGVTRYVGGRGPAAERECGPEARRRV
jgi:hypothetical protein